MVIRPPFGLVLRPGSLDGLYSNELQSESLWNLIGRPCGGAFRGCPHRPRPCTSFLLYQPRGSPFGPLGWQTGLKASMAGARWGCPSPERPASGRFESDQTANALDRIEDSGGLGFDREGGTLLFSKPGRGFFFVESQFIFKQ